MSESSIAITAGSGTSVATDLISSKHYQRMKLADGTADSTNESVVDSAGRLSVFAETLTNLTFTSAGLTTSVTAYTAGDVLGSEITLTNVTRASSRSTLIVNATLSDKAKIVGAVDAFIFDRASTPASDNAANSWTDADMLNCLGVISFDTPITSALNSVVTASNLNLVVTPNTGQNCYMVLVTRTGHTFFGAVGDLQVKLGVLQF